MRVLDGYMTVGMLVAFQSLVTSFMEPVEHLLWMGSSLQEVKGELNRLDDVLRYPADANLTRDPSAHADGLPPRLSGRLELRDITFGHSRLDPPLIEGFSVTIPPGARIALVGPSGSGKTTLAKIICGIHRPWSGEILLDGRPWEAVPRNVLTHTLAMVDQEFFLIEGTVREVLTLWDSTVSEDAIFQAAKDACIHDDIAARPGGYDSRVEEAGANFSGGQRQRLEIALALVGDPALLVLDEATSALDPITEKLIDDHLRRRGCTSVIVAHRLSTIRDCDEIILMDKGQIVQRGTHEKMPRDVARCRRLAVVRPYGLETPLTVSELLLPVSADPVLSDDDLRYYDQALASFLEGRWNEAYDQLHRVPPQDLGKAFLLSYILQHNNSPPAGWDGVIPIQSKS